jgi:hypothetical protein
MPEYVYDSRKQRCCPPDWATYLELPEIVAAGGIDKLLKLCETAADRLRCQTALNYVNMIEARVQLMAAALDSREWDALYDHIHYLLGELASTEKAVKQYYEATSNAYGNRMRAIDRARAHVKAIEHLVFIEATKQLAKL